MMISRGYIDKHGDGEETGGLIRFHGILPLGEMDILLVLPRRLQLLLVLKRSGRFVRGCRG